MKYKRFDQFKHKLPNAIRLKETIKNEILTIELVKDVGFADVYKYRRVQGGSTPFEYLANARTSIVYIAIMDEVILKFGRWYIVSLNNYLKQTNNQVVNTLKSHRLNSRGIIDEQITSNMIGKISFRQLAVLAGLGTIGKNACLLHPRYGPNVIVGVVVTDSYIPYDEPLSRELCLTCDICLSECPVKAISSDFFDRWRCKNRRKLLGKGCGIPCVKACPVGRT